MPALSFLRRLALLACALLLAGCEMLGIESPEKLALQKEAEGKAVGSACRHALRAIEDCYALNPKALKSAVFGGWREMDEYMRENKLEGVAPVLAKLQLSKGDADGDEADVEAPSGKPSARGKPGEHAAGKGRNGKPGAARVS